MRRLAYWALAVAVSGGLYGTVQLKAPAAAQLTRDWTDLPPLAFAGLTEPASVAEASDDPWARRRAEAAALEAHCLAEPETALAFVGDVMLSRDVETRTRRLGGNWSRLFAGAGDWLAAADLAVANLETPLVRGAPVGLNGMSFRADPSAAPALASAGFDLVTLANNHAMNQGARGLAGTLAALGAAGVRTVGAGADDLAAWQPAYLERRGLRWAFVAGNDADVVPRSSAAAPGRAGTAVIDVERVKAAVAEARASADVVVWMMHAGHEYQLRPNGRQVAYAEAALAAGADLVIGHHPHVVQTLAVSGENPARPVLYSLGNFVFDQTFSEETMEGLMARAVFRGSALARLEYWPVQLSRDYVPGLAGETSAARTLARLGEAVAPMPLWLFDRERGAWVERSLGQTTLADDATPCADRTAALGDATARLDAGRLSVARGGEEVWATPPELFVSRLLAAGDALWFAYESTAVAGQTQWMELSAGEAAWRSRDLGVLPSLAVPCDAAAVDIGGAAPQLAVLYGRMVGEPSACRSTHMVFYETTPAGWVERQAFPATGYSSLEAGVIGGRAYVTLSK
jgi:poly-gamma-glutamate capsule biosynthesis protein CapA/YwtB (metallophosphatase superfamily)